jgi:hypothetical protein
MNHRPNHPFPFLDLTSFPAIDAILKALEAPLFEYNGARRIQTNVLWQPKTPPWVTLAQLKDFGYERPETKLNALKRMYFNDIEAARIRALLKKREDQAYSAFALSTIAGAKDSRSMGHCINSIALAITPKRCQAMVMYRSTELIKKFSADLCFIPWVLDQLEVEIESVSFFFANCFVSGVFFPLLMRYIDPVIFLEFLRKREPEMFVVATRFLRRSVQTHRQDFPFSPEQHQHNYAWKHYPERMPEIYVVNQSRKSTTVDRPERLDGMDRKIEAQNKEFDAVNALSVQWRRIQMTPVVDNDYPAVRFDYERAVTNLIEAFRNNRRTL